MSANRPGLWRPIRAATRYAGDRSAPDLAEDTEMKRVGHGSAAILIVIMSLAPTTRGADQRSSTPLREANSDNRRFQLRIRPGRPGEDAIRGCKAGLYERVGDRRGGRALWERFLVNDVAPGRAFIRDDGRFVVTLDEYRRGGARNAMVIYGENGELLRHFLLPDLLDRSDWAEVKKNGEAVDWLDGARFQFLDEPPMFVVTLRHGGEIRVDLEKLQVVRKSGAVSGVSAIPREMLTALYGPNARPASQPAGAETVRPRPEKRRQPDVAVAITKGDGEGPQTDVAQISEPEDLPVSDEVAAMEGAEAADEIAGEAVESEDSQTMDEEDAGFAVAEEEADPLDQMAEEVRAETSVEASKWGGVPQPDPAAPVDYLAWARSFITIEGPSAVPEYEAIMASVAPWKGSRESLKAALAGDPSVLGTPDIRAWLADNQDALDHFRKALTLEYKGWPLKSGDGSFIAALLPNLSPVREVSCVSVVQGRLHAAAGLADSAAECYLDALAGGAQAGSGFTLIESLVGAGIQKLAAEALLDLQADPAGEQLDYVALAERLEEDYRSPSSPSETLQAERAFFLDTVQSMYTYDSESGTYTLDAAKATEFLHTIESPPREDVAARVERLHQIDFKSSVADGNDYYDKLGQALALPYPEAQQMLEALERRFQEPNKSNPLLIPAAYSRYHTLRAGADALRRATRLVTHLNAYRQQFGDYPESLEVFGGADFTVDPFTGDNLKYERTGGTFRLYSVGPNGADEGGVHDPRGENNDIVYWPRP